MICELSMVDQAKAEAGELTGRAVSLLFSSPGEGDTAEGAILVNQQDVTRVFPLILEQSWTLRSGQEPRSPGGYLDMIRGSYPTLSSHKIPAATPQR